jgi:hypothetical protein
MKILCCICNQKKSRKDAKGNAWINLDGSKLRWPGVDYTYICKDYRDMIKKYVREDKLSS